MFKFFRSRGLQDHPYVKATTPDQLIAAHFIESFAKDFQSWAMVCAPPAPLFDQSAAAFRTTHQTKEAWREEYPEGITNALSHCESKLTLCYREQCTRQKTVRDGYHVRSGALWVPIVPSCGYAVVTAYLKIAENWAELQRVASEAHRKMAEDERKWNLAESLLGMKRNEFGALVPVRKAS